MTGWIVAGGMLGGLVCLSLCGCDRDVVPISGRVTLSGKPLSGAVVTFQPIADQNPPQPSATGSVGPPIPKGDSRCD